VTPRPGAWRRGRGAATAGDGAIDQVVARIIEIESGGRARARNPRSTATGLGQFIDSTWMRMMRTYRPELTARHTRSELLSLRTDPALSAEMVARLARESAAYLRARGLRVTPGRLYLAHFLGMEGAVAALGAAPETPLRGLLGAGVIAANPFLEGRDVAWLVNWSERKMSGASGRVTVIREPEGLDRFRDMVDRLLDAA